MDGSRRGSHGTQAFHTTSGGDAVDGYRQIDTAQFCVCITSEEMGKFGYGGNATNIAQDVTHVSATFSRLGPNVPPYSLYAERGRNRQEGGKHRDESREESTRRHPGRWHCWEPPVRGLQISAGKYNRTFSSASCISGVRRALFHRDVVNIFCNRERSLVRLDGKREGLLWIVGIIGSLNWHRSGVVIFIVFFSVESPRTTKRAINAYIDDSYNCPLSRVRP